MKYRSDMHIYLDNLTYGNGNVTHSLSDIIDFVIQYRFQGGPEQPIRYLEMKVNKNDIDIAHPHLIDSVVEGKTRLIVDAVGGGTFIITKLWLNGNEYDIVATGIEVTLNTATLTQADISAINDIVEQYGVADPPKVIRAIFDNWEDTLNLTTAQDGYADDFDIYFSNSVSENRTSPGYQIRFKENMPTLVAINMCALLDGAFVFFANRNGKNMLHYVRYEDINPLAYNPGDDDKNGVVNIYPRMNSQYTNYTKFDLMMFKQLVGLSSKNSEGSETIVNNQIVSMEGGRGESTSIESNRMYGDYAGAQVISDMMISYDWTHTVEGVQVTESTSQKIADNLVKRYKDPTRSITIVLSEVKTDDTGTGWEESISAFSYAKKIVDNVNNITLTNTHLCDGTPDNFMLRLSTFIRAYPEMTTEYTFGVMKETTLSQELANKLTGMSGTVADMRYDGESVVSNGIVTIDQVPTDGSHNPVSSNGTYDAIQSAIQGVAPQGTIGSDAQPLKLLNGTLTQVAHPLLELMNGTTNAGSIPTWGTLTSGNGYTFSWGAYHNGGGLITATHPDSGGQTSMQLDGFFYQDEGRYKCIDTNQAQYYLQGYSQSSVRNANTRVIGGAWNAYGVQPIPKTGTIYFGTTFNDANYVTVVVVPYCNDDFPADQVAITEIGTSYFKFKHGSGVIQRLYWIAMGQV